jgi:hypothetical protein
MPLWFSPEFRGSADSVVFRDIELVGIGVTSMPG